MTFLRSCQIRSLLSHKRTLYLDTILMYTNIKCWFLKLQLATHLYSYTEPGPWYNAQRRHSSIWLKGNLDSWFKTRTFWHMEYLLNAHTFQISLGYLCRTYIGCCIWKQLRLLRQNIRRALAAVIFISLQQRHPNDHMTDMRGSYRLSFTIAPEDHTVNVHKTFAISAEFEVSRQDIINVLSLKWHTEAVFNLTLTRLWVDVCWGMPFAVPNQCYCCVPSWLLPGLFKLCIVFLSLQ